MMPDNENDEVSMSFKVEQAIQGGKTALIFSGKIDEDADFSNIKLPSTNEIFFDLEKITLINSCGTRNWARWVRTFPANLVVVFVNCPRVFIDQANIFNGFFPKAFAIKSFFVPYFCESCKNASNVLLTIGKEVTPSHIEFPEAKVCETCQGRAEIDVIESSYFKFLWAHKEVS